MKKIIAGVFIVGGIFLMLGAERDCNGILRSDGEMFLRLIIGMCAIGGGYVIGKIIKGR